MRLRGGCVDQLEAVEPPLHRERRDSELRREVLHVVLLRKRGTHFRFGHDELRGEDVRLTLDSAVGRRADVLMPAEDGLCVPPVEAMADPVTELMREREPLAGVSLV